MATNFAQNWQNDLYLAGWRYGTVRNMAVTIQKYSIAILSTLYANIIKINLVTSEITRVTTAPFWTRGQRSAYTTEYVDNYYSDLYQLFSIGRHMEIIKLT